MHQSPIAWGAAAVALALLVAVSPAAADPQGPSPVTAATPGSGPDARATYMALIVELQAQGQSYAALAHVAQYESRWGASPETQVLQADALRATGQDDKAAAIYRQLLQGPRAAAAHRGLGLMEAARGQWRPAIEQLSAAARLDPTDATTLSDLGYANLRGGRVDDARVPLMTAAQLRPTDSRVLANLASYFMASGQQERADAVLRSPHISESARALVRKQHAPVAALAPSAPMAPIEAIAAEAPAPSLRLAQSLALGDPGAGRTLASPQGGIR
ncbi:MAG: pilus assembly protein [Comamonadaceae bacterium]|nr:MAG: pilus assembly protein [Comamonadaceae bacterium]